MPNFDQNKLYAKPGPYVTKLAPEQEQSFEAWVKQNNVPWQDSPTSDYDMRGYYQAMLAGNAGESLNNNDGKMHFPDTWKTPYHQSFSRESEYATDGAPSWNSLDQLVLPNGTVVFDERKRAHQMLQKGAP